MSHVVFTTCALLREPYGHPDIDSFDELTPVVFTAAETAPGFVTRANYADDCTGGSDLERDWGSWGPFAMPSFYPGGRTPAEYRAAQSLSVWRDLESVHNFVYSGVHAQALSSRRTWFEEVRWPTYALWWMPGNMAPTWVDACQRLEMLADRGPTPAAFDLRHCFDQHGEPVELRHGSTRRESDAADGVPTGSEVT